MLAAARARPGTERIGWRRARAEALPFRDGWFDAVHAHLVLHAVADRRQALAEMARVCAAGGRVAVVSFAREHFDRFYLAPYFPSLAGIDRARFPEPARLASGLEAAGFAGVRCEPVSQERRLEPADVLERVRGRFISTLHLLPEAEYEQGLARLEAEVAGGRAPFAARLEWVLLSGGR
jgi:SAM-dependent methyltransferase